MSVFSNKGAIEIVNHKIDFSNFGAPAGLSRQGSLGERKAFLARGPLLCPSRASCSCSAFVHFTNVHRAPILLGVGNVQTNETGVWPPCMSED